MQKKKNKKITIDDGMNQDLVDGAEFDGYLGIPIIEKPNEIRIPSGFTPFSMLNKIEEDEAICFFEMDENFSDVLKNPVNFIESFKNHILITPDCSLYTNAPLSVQITNIYRNRAIGYYYQSKGVYVIPLVRWGNSLTYTTDVLPEKAAFLGIRKHSIVAISTYGCIMSHYEKIVFKEGLKSMLETLEPEIVLVYGSDCKFIFSEFSNKTKFIFYPDWITRKHGGK